jgi:hypothetical protein
MGGHPLSEDNPIRHTFQSLAARGLEQADIRDDASVRYIGNLLVEFLRTEDMYRVRDESGRRIEHLGDLLAVAEESKEAAERRRLYRYLGDFTLFMLGLFPERLARPRRAVSADYYALHGSRSYGIVADLAWTESEPELYRRLSAGFERYVGGLNWVKLYIEDPFFQFMFREFGIS